MPAATSAAAPSPCTRAGQTSTWRGEAVGEPVQDVADDGAGRRGDDADDARQIGQRALAAFVEETLGGELLAPLLEERHERADAGRLQRAR